MENAFKQGLEKKAYMKPQVQDSSFKNALESIFWRFIPGLANNSKSNILNIYLFILKVNS